MLARFILPWFGGTPAVWTTCLLFFQVALLLGYAWAHGLEKWLGGRGVVPHLILVALSCLTLPLVPDVHLQPGPDTEPIGRILIILTLSVGAPYVLLAATAPLVQARAAARFGREVHRLYAWSNIGSIVGLLSFPLLMEPLLRSQTQAEVWSAAYLGYGIVLGFALWPTRTLTTPTVAAGTPPQAGDRSRWLGFSAGGSALLLTITETINQDLSVMPLFWVVPLLLYLLSFVLAFGAEKWVSRRYFGPLFGLALVGTVLLVHLGYRAHWAVQLGGWSAVLFTGCTLAHGELVRARPGPGHLTGFYLWMALGGALGGVFVGVIAPLVFPMHLELHLTALGLWGLFLWVLAHEHQTSFQAKDGPRLLLAVFSIALVIGLGAHVWHRLNGETTVHRSFFGTLQVKKYRPKKHPERAILHLLDGRISHGFQYLDSERRTRPTAYFAPETGVGRLLSQPGQDRHIGIVGLGVGTLAAYGRTGDRLRFYEINPDVVRIAQERFTFLSDSPAAITVVEGDGRLAIHREEFQGFDHLILDAFSGDAIPAHLITREAFQVYRRHLKPEGMMAINVSNRHVNLSQVVRTVAVDAGFYWIWIRHHAKSPFGRYRSDWMLLARRAAQLDPFREASRALPVGSNSRVLWTDDFAPLLPLLLKP